jgi:hypothetical protein
MIWPILVSPLGRHVEIHVGSEQFLAAPAINRIGMKYLARLVLEENAVARKIFKAGIDLTEVV